MGEKVVVTRDAATLEVAPLLTPYVPAALKSGGIYPPGHPTSQNGSLAEGEMVAHPFDWRPGLGLAAIYAFVNTAGSTGAVIRLGVYADDNGRPTTLLFGGGTISAESTGVKQADPNLSTATLAVTRRLWLACAVQGGASTRPVMKLGTGRLPGINTGTTASTSFDGNVNGFTTSGVTGALPDPWPAGGYNLTAGTVIMLARPS
jgi:hypothetical protein